MITKRRYSRAIILFYAIILNMPGEVVPISSKTGPGSWTILLADAPNFGLSYLLSYYILICLMESSDEYYKYADLVRGRWRLPFLERVFPTFDFRPSAFLSLKPHVFLLMRPWVIFPCYFGCCDIFMLHDDYEHHTPVSFVCFVPNKLN